VKISGFTFFRNGQKLGYQVQRVATGIGVPPRGKLWPALKSHRLPAVLMRHNQRDCLAMRG
jgi:hypothetical protein